MSVLFKLDEFETILSKIATLMSGIYRPVERSEPESAPLDADDEIRLAPEEPLVEIRRKITSEVVELMTLVTSLESVVYLSSDTDVLDRYVAIVEDLYNIRKSLKLPHGASVILDSD